MQADDALEQEQPLRPPHYEEEQHEQQQQGEMMMPDWNTSDASRIHCIQHLICSA
jgi:hypothetical protein